MLKRLVLVALLLGGGALAADYTYLKPQRLVAVDGGRRLNLACTGHGSPTVLLDAGLGDSMLVWRRVQGEIAKVTRVCAYDRAGYGFSDPGPEPRDALAAVADIHRLVRGLKAPVIYVGHSIAGLYGLLLAQTHPEDVVGEVLVDPAFSDQFDTLTAVLPETLRQGAAAMYAAQFQAKRDCLAKAEQGEPVAACAGTTAGPPPLDAAQKAQAARQVAQPSYMRANISEYASFLPGDANAVSRRELDGVAPDFGDKPLVILTRTVAGFPFSPEQNAAAMRAWTARHDAMAKLSRRGSDTVVPDSGHYIQIDQPQAVIDAVAKAVAMVRER